MDIELALDMLRRDLDRYLTAPVKTMYFRAIGEPLTREVFLPLDLEGWCANPHIAPACNRRISRTWCNGNCIGQSCIFWGSEGIGTINLER